MIRGRVCHEKLSHDAWQHEFASTFEVKSLEAETGYFAWLLGARSCA